MKKAVILTSGGLDSTTCLAVAQSMDYECHTLAFDYGQKHRVELQAAADISKLYKAKSHRVFQIPIGQLKGSALTDDNIDIPAYSNSNDIPLTYVPARNTIFLSIALAYAEVIDAESIFIGVSSVDYSHYPDCRPEYIAQYQAMADLATKEGATGQKITIQTPLIHLSKAQTVALGVSLGVDYGKTISCYAAGADGLACGQCDSCYLRRKGFQEAGMDDPTEYKIPSP